MLPSKQKLLFFFLATFICSICNSQELFVNTEPASNMASHNLGIRVNSKLFKTNHDSSYKSYRIEPEIMIGVNRNLMLHAAVYASNMFQKKLKLEGGSIYGKYRFLSFDDIHKHFRMAGFARISVSNAPQTLQKLHKHSIPDGSGGYVLHDELVWHQSNDIDLEGSTSGVTGGIVATNLKNKLAVSGSLAYAYRMNNIGNKVEQYQARSAISYTASAGYLLLPREYTSYKQTNVNLYVELLGSSFLDKRQSYIDIAPAIQFIINSIAKVDLAYRTQLKGNVERMANSNFQVRLEYNLLNVL